MPGWNRKGNSVPAPMPDQSARRPHAAYLRAWGAVIKITLCVPMALATGFGFLLHSPTPGPGLGGAILGVLFLACGCAGINSVQEVSVDGLFRRTRTRPLVTGSLRTEQAAWISALLVLLGLTILALSSVRWAPPVLGLAALVFYNGLYTPLKQVSAFALVPGGLAGAMPPLIGWTAAGGRLDGIHAWMLLGLFFLWQIPHFCLVLLRHREEYAAAAQPSLLRLFSESTLKRIALVWISAFVVATLTLALDRTLLHPGSRLTLVLMAFLVVLVVGPGLLRQRPPNYRRLLLLFNAAFFAAMLVVAVLQLLPFSRLSS